MPQTKTRKPSKVSMAAPVENPGVLAPLSDAKELIGRMLEFEAAAKANNVKISTGRFEQLTASERQFLRAELVSDYIRLCAGNLGNTPVLFDASLADFSAKICDMKIPSTELIGTYLAATDVVKNEPLLNEVEGLSDSIRRSMMTVLRNCVEMMQDKAQKPAA